MTINSAMDGGRCEKLLDALRAEFGAMLAERILEAEAADFLWEARVKERYLGQHIDADLGSGEGFGELARMLISSVLDGRRYIALCLVDGDGQPVELLWKRSFDGQDEAEAAFGSAA